MSNSTFVMLKPDAIQRELEEEILKVFSEHGLKIVRSQTIIVDEQLILKHYEEVIERLNVPDFPQRIIDGFVGKEVIIFELTIDNEEVIPFVRDLIGPTDPKKAANDTIRGYYGDDSMELAVKEKRLVRNLIHASDSSESATMELKLWFK